MQRLHLVLTGITVSQLLATPLQAADIDAYMTAAGPPVELTWDLCLSGDYAYLVSPWDGLRIVDLSAPLSPEALGLCLANSAKGVAVAPPHAYLLDSFWGLRIVDVSDPAQPKQVGTYTNVGPGERMAISSGHLYVPTAEGKLEVLDLSNPVKPKKTGECTTGGKGKDLKIAGAYAYVACGPGGIENR
jgi:hypothetical protein